MFAFVETGLYILLRDELQVVTAEQPLSTLFANLTSYHLLLQYQGGGLFIRIYF